MQFFVQLLIASVFAFAIYFAFLSFTRKVSVSAVARLPKYLNAKSTREVQLLPNANTQANSQELFKLTPRYRAWLVKQLKLAGLHNPNALAVLLQQKRLYLVMGIVLGALVLATNLQTGGLYLVGFAALGFFMPDLLTLSAAQKRELQINRSLADSIDLLCLCVESGLSFEQAAARVSISLDGPVAEELAALLNEMQLGASRSQAIEESLQRTNSRPLSQFLTSLLQVEGLGISLSHLLQDQAKQLRAMRKDLARESAQKVSVKIVVPLIFCFLPAIFILVLGPAVASLLQTFAFMAS